MKNIIWDLDGTLVDSAKEINECLELAVKKSGLDLSKQIKPFVIGPTIEKILKEAFPIEVINDELLKDTIKHFREIYDNSDFEQTKPFPGIEEIVFDTKNYTHHIVTNKPDTPTNRIFDKINWSKYIASVNTPYTRTNSSNNKLQSKTELFFFFFNENGCNISSFIGIGDMKSDCIAAKDNNITTIGVLWGTGTREELSDCCDYLFDNVKQLRDYLYGIL
jgi:phosphoglycolate phosphatase